MTDNSDKIRSIVLAALMVFSVFAGTVALSGTVAATATGVTVQDSDSTYAAGDTVTFTVTDNSNGDEVQYFLDTNDNGEFDEGEPNGSVTGSAGASGDQTLDIPSDAENGDYLIRAVQNATLNGGEAGEANATITVDNDAPTLRKATHYVDSDDGALIELAFTEDIGTAPSDVTVGFDDGDTETLAVSDDNDDARITLSTSGEVYSDIRNVTIAEDTFEDTAGNPVAADDYDVTFAPSTVEAGNLDADSYVGSNIAFEANNTNSEIDFDGPSFSPTRSTGSGSQVFVVNSDDFDEGTYNASFQDGGSASVELTSLGLSASADNVTTDDAVTATIEADDVDRDVNVELLDSDDEVVDSTTVTIDADGQATVDFGTQDAGDYTVVATDVATEVEAEDSLTVSEASDATATLTQNTFDVSQGGIAEIDVELSATTEGTLVIGDEADDGYQANVTFTDENEDGEVTIQFNTYNAGTANGVVSAEGDDEANLNSDDTDLGTALLGQGGYDLAVGTGHAADGQEVTESGNSDFGSLSIAERSTDSMTLWTAPSGEDGSDVLDSVTEDNTIAAGDWVVHQVKASGLEGLVDGDLSAAFGNGVNVTVEQTEETAKQNRQPKTLNLSEVEDSEIELIADAENESYYIAIDTSTDAFERPNADGLTASVGEEYTATFTVDDTKLVGEDAEDHESVNATFEVVAGTASLDETPVEVTATEDAEISGSSTLAPGSEIRVVVESTEGTSPRLYANPTATVQADGTWNVTVDFSEQTAGDIFEVRSDYFDTADGEVVESTSESTATATPEPTETATPEPTETATPEPTETDAPDETDEPTETPEDDTTTTTTPGFGVAVALVALLAAALLAGRRE